MRHHLRYSRRRQCASISIYPIIKSGTIQQGITTDDGSTTTSTMMTTSSLRLKLCHCDDGDCSVPSVTDMILRTISSPETTNPDICQSGPKLPDEDICRTRPRPDPSAAAINSSLSSAVANAVFSLTLTLYRSSRPSKTASSDGVELPADDDASWLHVVTFLRAQVG